MKSPESYNSLEALLDPNSVVSRFTTMVAERRYTLKAVQLSSRVLNHWVDQKILPKLPIEEGCYKFSICDIFYIEIIKALRKFGISLSQLQTVRKWLIDTPHITSALIQILANPKDQTYLVVNNDGVAWVVGSEFLISDKVQDYDEDEKPIDFSSFICVHLNKIILPVLSDPSRVQIHYPDLKVLSKTECEIVSAVRNSDLHQLKIKFKKGKPFEIEESWDSGDVTKAIENVNYINYGQIQIKIRNSKKQYARSVRKKRLS